MEFKRLYEHFERISSEHEGATCMKCSQVKSISFVSTEKYRDCVKWKSCQDANKQTVYL